MTLSVWRYSHLVLAISSSLFIAIAAITGIILAFEPISNAAQPYTVANLESISLATTIDILQDQYDAVLELAVTADDFVLASVITSEGRSQKSFIDPTTGAILGTPKERAPIFTFATNIHRSLFLKSIGRFFIGLISFLLCLIAITGFVLLVKRQGGISKIFSKVHKDYFELRYHVLLSRWFIVPIAIIAATGVFLSAEKFELLPSDSIQHSPIDHSEIPEAINTNTSIFELIMLSDLRNLTFPFSEDPEDYYEVALSDRAMMVHQYSGEVISEAAYPFVRIATQWSMFLHTGEGSVVWSIVLLLSCLALLFFIYSGFTMTIRRRRNIPSKISSMNKDECEIIILIGSETGSTFDFGRRLQDALLAANKTVYMAEMNAYTTYTQAKHLIILTATYGEGEATSNADKFEDLLANISPIQNIPYSVVGFGSTAYPNYCQFAIKVNALLQLHPSYQPLLPLSKINNQSNFAFKQWVDEWSAASGIHLDINASTATVAKIGLAVVHRTALNIDDTFTIRMRPQEDVEFQSGDLLVLNVEEDDRARLYSIAKIDDDILLSVKLHKDGLCSNYLNSLTKGDALQGAVRQNDTFHFPEKSKHVILIANGTGIAPFIGMLDENNRRIDTTLFWGGRTTPSYDLYNDWLRHTSEEDRLSAVQLAFSQEASKTYVQDLLPSQSDLIRNTLMEKGEILICGSLRMQKDTLAVLEDIIGDDTEVSLSDYQDKGQIKMDCY